MGVEPMSPPTALLLSDGISPNEEVTSELDCTSIISVASRSPTTHRYHLQQLEIC